MVSKRRQEKTEDEIRLTSGLGLQKTENSGESGRFA